ncbi:hypothetical protein KUV57_11320 [Epibacterium sp. DP7N7-1]|nr:hypothetical protein [Epibacterium sp. DP7N7-1]
MPYITTRNQREVTHIGHLESDRSDRRPTVDGPGIAVSICPDTWRSIKGLNGPEYTMEYQPAQWVDALSFNGQDIEELIAWMINQRYMTPVTAWSVTVFDDGKEDFVEFSSLDRGAAAAKAGRSLEEEIVAAGRGEGAVTEEETYQLTKRGMARLGGVRNWPDPLKWFDGAVLLYTREVVMQKRPFVVGVWWNEPRSPEHGLADYGVLFPERAHLFEIEDEEGEVRSFKDTFPGCPGTDTKAWTSLLDELAGDFLKDHAEEFRK